MRRVLLSPRAAEDRTETRLGAHKSGHLGQRAPSGETSACCGHADALAHAPFPLPSLAPSLPPHPRTLRKLLQTGASHPHCPSCGETGSWPADSLSCREGTYSLGTKTVTSGISLGDARLNMFTCSPLSGTFRSCRSGSLGSRARTLGICKM